MRRALKWTLAVLSVFVLGSCALVAVAVRLGDTPSREPDAGVMAQVTDRPEETAASESATVEPVQEYTFTPLPTYTEQATYTPGPTYTPQPTHTPLPTDTRRPTNTPRPTSSPRPTSTPAPTATSVPTRTPTPRPQSTATPAPAQAVLPANAETAVVTHIVDGDTIDVTINGNEWRVRYIGMDTPEIGSACAREATAANASLVAGQTVRLVRDVSQTDRYGRLLRYVYVGDTFVNGALVAGGWAIAKDYPPDTAMAAVLHSLESQGANRGCALAGAALATIPARGPGPISPPPVPQPTQAQPQPTQPPAAQPTQPPTSGNCDPSYPGVCIPPPPPDLDCGDIPYRRFQVVGSDPHKFDGDHNGIGCESG